MSATVRRATVGGWGRWPTTDAELIEVTDRGAAADSLRDGPLAVRGAGRSYGDSSLAERMLDMRRLTRLRSFDPESGVVELDAGVTIEELLRLLGPRGWFPPVTPGTRLVTVGGALASDVHGKNHHVCGSFADHVLSFELLLGGGEVVTVSPELEPELFRATAGGMGLTGVILSVRMRMLAVSSGRIRQLSLKLPDVRATVAALEEHAAWTYSAAWIDCQSSGRSLGRSLLLLGEHAADGSRDMLPASPPLPVPFELPSRTLSHPLVGAFNALYYGRQRRDAVTAEIPASSFFYPLDVAAHWNRLYGRRGFMQYQFVSPADAGHEPLVRALELISDAGTAAPLAVLKAFGPANANLLSFPMRGYTLAVDLPVSRSTLELADRLDAIVLDCGGRIYLSKDARMSAETFRACYPRWEEFEAVRERHGAVGHFASLQSRRLGLA